MRKCSCHECKSDPCYDCDFVVSYHVQINKTSTYQSINILNYNISNVNTSSINRVNMSTYQWMYQRINPSIYRSVCTLCTQTHAGRVTFCSVYSYISRRPVRHCGARPRHAAPLVRLVARGKRGEQRGRGTTERTRLGNVLICSSQVL